MPWRLGMQAYVRLSNGKAVGEFLQLEQAFPRASHLAVMSVWVSREAVFHRLNARERSVVPVDNQMDLIRHPAKFRFFVNSPATVYQVEVRISHGFFVRHPLKISIHG